MKTGDYFEKSSMSQRISDAKGKYSTQSMRESIMKENPAWKKTLEENVRMG